MQKINKVVITGIGIFNSLGNNVNQFYCNLIENKTGIKLKKEWTYPEIENIFVSLPDNIPFTEYFKNLKLPYPQKYSQLGMIGCYSAMKDAGIEFPVQENNDRVGLILNTTFGANESVENYLVKLYNDGPAKVSPFLFTQTVANCAIGDISKYFCLKGVSSLLLGESSIPYGFDLIKNNKADIVIVGGFDQIRDITIWSFFKKNLLLSLADLNSEENFYVKTIENVINKTIIGQSSAFIVLENAEYAKNRNARVYAELSDYCSLTDKNCNKYIIENSTFDYELSLKSLCQRTNENINDIDLFIGSSCLPWQIKNIDLSAIKRLIDIDKQTYYSTPKSKLGETFGSSGELALAYGSISLFNGIIPGLGYEEEIFHNFSKSIFLPKLTVENKNIKKVIVNSSYIGGNVTSLLLKKYLN